MRKMLIVLQHEFLVTVKRRGFWISLIIVPIFTGAIALISILGSTAAVAASAAGRQAQLAKPEGYVDRAHALASVEASGGISQNLVRFASEEEARAALARGEIQGFYAVPADYVASGKVRYISDQFTPFESLGRTAAFAELLQLGLLQGDRAALARINRPLDLQRREAVAPVESKGGVGLPFSPAPIIATVLFFIVLMTASSYLMNGVSTEKETRVMEVLMSSVSPMQLLVGKILGLSLVGLLQLGLWLTSGIWVLRFLPLASQVIGGINLGTIALAVIFFIMGYFIYATAMAGLGALMPTSREAAQYTIIIILPLMLPMYFLNVFMLEPNGAIATALSLFPLTAPVSMVARLAATDVPAAQVALSLILVAATTAVVIWSVTRVFRAQTLLSGTKPTLRQIWLALRG